MIRTKNAIFDTCEDVMTGKPFHYNDVVRVDGVLTPAWTGPKRTSYLHPSRVPVDVLAELNAYDEQLRYETETQEG